MTTETMQAGRNDSWSAYTEVSGGLRPLEVRHPRPPMTMSFTLHEWSENTGYHSIGHFDTFDDAMAAAAARVAEFAA